MPTMMRVNDKAKKIAEKILGVPAPLRDPKKKNTWREKRLVFEDTQRVR